MRLEQLEYLLTISNSPSINAASQKLHISYQALNYSIKSLEQELDLQLLTRTNKGSILTEDGYKMVALARQFILGLNSIKNENKKPETRFSGKISILAMDICLEYILFDSIDYFRKTYPDIVIEYKIITSYKQLTEALREDINAFAIFFRRKNYFKVDLPEDIREYRLLKSEIRVLCSPMHEFCQASVLSYEQIKEYPLLLRRDAIIQDNARGPLASANIYVEPNPVLFEKEIRFGNYYTFAHAVPCAPYWIPLIDNTMKIKLQTDEESYLALSCHKNFIANDETKEFLNVLFSKLCLKKRI